jgi:hypothetical protein
MKHFSKLALAVCASALLSAPGLVAQEGGLLSKLKEAAAAAAPAGARQPLAPEVAKLLPAGAVAVLQLASIDSVESSAKKVVGAVDPRSARQVDLSEMIGPLAGLGLDVDRSKPFAIAMTLPATPESEPVATIIAPLKDLAKAKEALAGQGGAETVQWEGNYVGLGSNGPYERGEAGAFLGTGLPAGLFAGVADLATIIDFYRPMIEEGISELEGLAQMFGEMPGMSDFAAIASTLARQTVDEAGRFELGINAADTAVDLAGGLFPRAGKTMSLLKAMPGADTARMTSILQGGYPLAMVTGFNLQGFWAMYEKLMGAFLSQMPADEAKNLQAMMGKIGALYSGIGPGMGMGLRVGQQGLEMGAILESKDANGYMKAMTDMMKDPVMAEVGVQLADIQEIDVAGAKGVRMRSRMDLSKMMMVPAADEESAKAQAEQMGAIMKAVFGSETMDFAIVPSKGSILMTIGGSDSYIGEVASAAGSAKLDPMTQAAVNKVGPKAILFLHTELRSLLVQATGLVGKMGQSVPPVDPKGPAAPITIFISAKDGGMGFGLSTEAAGLGKIVKEMR